jgi:hypothetical protein
MNSECERCGSASAQLVNSRWHLGLIVYGRTMGTQAVLCREHARSLVAADLAKTALLGWWGAYSVFINAFTLCAQIAELARVGKFATSSGSQETAPSGSVSVGAEAVV